MVQTVLEVKVTPRQLEILRLIGEFQARQCYSATMAEVAEAAGVSRTTAFEHIASLRKKGLLVKSKGRARSLKLTSMGCRLLEYHSELQADCGGGSEGVKLVGRVAAGAPIEAIENVEEISLRSVFGDGEDLFALEVRGDSMIDEGIDTGDYVVCRRSANANDGEMVVAIVDEENATLKRFYKEDGFVRLEASNSAYEAICVEDCRIEGVVVGVVRKL